MGKLKALGYCLVCFIFLSLSACTSSSNNRLPQYKGGPTKRDAAPREYADVSRIPNAVPKVEPRSRYGNPKSYKIKGKRYRVLKSAKGYDRVGYASWYGTRFHGKLTSSREPYNLYAMTAASPHLPLPTYLKVTNLSNGRSVIVKVNDRGPFKRGRILDLSYAAARKLNYAHKGVAKVRITAIDPVKWAKENRRYQQRQYAAYKSVSKQQFARNHQRITQKIAKYKKDLVHLQVGAFSNRGNAEQMKKRVLRLVQTRQHPVKVNRDKQKLYRVQITSTHEDSARLQRLLHQDGLKTMTTVRG